MIKRKEKPPAAEETKSSDHPSKEKLESKTKENSSNKEDDIKASNKEVKAAVTSLSRLSLEGTPEPRDAQIIFDHRCKQFEQDIRVFQTQDDLEKEIKNDFVADLPNFLGVKINAHLAALKTERRNNLLLSVLIYGTEGKTYLKPGYKLNQEVSDALTECKISDPESIANFIEKFGDSVVVGEIWGRSLWLILEFQTVELSEKNQLTADLEFNFHNGASAKGNVSRNLSKVFKRYQFKAHYVVNGWDISAPVSAGSQRNESIWNVFAKSPDDNESMLIDRLMQIVYRTSPTDMELEPVLLGYETQSYVEFVDKKNLLKAQIIQTLMSTAQGLLLIANKCLSLTNFLLSSLNHPQIVYGMLTERESPFIQPKLKTANNLYDLSTNIIKLRERIEFVADRIKQVYSSQEELRKIGKILIELIKDIENIFNDKPKVVYIPIKRFNADTIQSCFHKAGEFYEKLFLPVGTKYLVLVRTDPDIVRNKTISPLRDEVAFYKDLFGQSAGTDNYLGAGVAIGSNVEKLKDQNQGDSKSQPTESDELIKSSNGQIVAFHHGERMVASNSNCFIFGEDADDAYYEEKIMNWRAQHQAGDFLFVKRRNEYLTYSLYEDKRDRRVKFRITPIPSTSSLGRHLASVKQRDQLADPIILQEHFNLLKGSST